MHKSMDMKELRELQGREAPEQSERSEPIERPLLESEKHAEPEGTPGRRKQAKFDD